MYDESGRRTAAQTLQRLNPSELLYGSDRLIEAHHLYGMGAVHEKRQEFNDAQRLYEEALAIYEEIFGTQHLTTALVTRNLARVLRVQGKIAEADLLEDHANDFFSRGGQETDDNAVPFGGSSGFFSLLGMDNRLTVADLEAAARDNEPENHAGDAAV
jgi:hypothetical protein